MGKAALPVSGRVVTPGCTSGGRRRERREASSTWKFSSSSSVVGRSERLCVQISATHGSSSFSQELCWKYEFRDDSQLNHTHIGIGGEVIVMMKHISYSLEVVEKGVCKSGFFCLNWACTKP